MKRYEYHIIASDKCHAPALPGIDVLLPVSDNAFSEPNGLLHHTLFKHKRMKPILFDNSLVRC